MDFPIKTAFVLGAGLGTRLRPLTNVCPKPLMPIFGKPLITFALDHLRTAGLGSFVINTHHLPEQFDEYFASGQYAGHPVKLVYEPVLLETGGGIKNAEQWIGNEPFIVYSGDILTDIDITALIEEHFRRKNDVTLALRNTGLAANIAFRDGRVVDIRKRFGQPGEYDFANVSIWNADIYRRIPANEKISFIPVLADWMAEGARVGGMVLNDREWFNIGSRAEYLAVHRRIAEGMWKPAYVDDAHWPVRIDPSATIAPGAHVSSATVVGAGTAIKEGVHLEDCVIWENVEVVAGSSLRNCVVTSGRRVEGTHADADL